MSHFFAVKFVESGCAVFQTVRSAFSETCLLSDLPHTCGRFAPGCFAPNFRSWVFRPLDVDVHMDVWPKHVQSGRIFGAIQVGLR